MRKKERKREGRGEGKIRKRGGEGGGKEGRGRERVEKESGITNSQGPLKSEEPTRGPNQERSLLSCGEPGSCSRYLGPLEAPHSEKEERARENQERDTE